MGKQSQKLVNNGGQISRLSDYQAGKRSSRQESRNTNTNKAQDTKQCGNSGKSDHTSKLNNRRKNCPAFEQTCSKCQTNGHFAKQCRGGLRSTRLDRSKSKDNKKVSEVKVADDDKNKDQGTVGTLSGSSMLINGRQAPKGSNDNEAQDVLRPSFIEILHGILLYLLFTVKN